MIRSYVFSVVLSVLFLMNLIAGHVTDDAKQARKPKSVHSTEEEETTRLAACPLLGIHKGGF